MRKKLFKVRRRFKESNVLFQSDNSDAIKAAIMSLEHHRIELEKYIISHPNFQYTLRPLKVETNSPRIVKIMVESTQALNIGPMASVAGALADLAVEKMLDFDVDVAIVENGGEISAYSKEEFTVGLYTERTGLSKRFGFLIEPSDSPIGIGTSSATVSHAFSYGEADVATTFADTAALADATATAICNVVKGNNIERAIKKGLRFADDIDFIRGTLIIWGELIGAVGKIPKIISTNKNIEKSLFR